MKSACTNSQRKIYAYQKACISPDKPFQNLPHRQPGARRRRGSKLLLGLGTHASRSFASIAALLRLLQTAHWALELLRRGLDQASSYIIKTLPIGYPGEVLHSFPPSYGEISTVEIITTRIPSSLGLRKNLEDQPEHRCVEVQSYKVSRKSKPKCQ